MKLIKKGDKIIAFLILLFACLLYLLFNLIIFDGKPQTAEVYVDGKFYASYRLNNIKNTKLVRIETEFGSNTLELSGNGVRVTDASCKDKVDVRAGKISKSNQMIICVPNRFSVHLTGDGCDVDKVSH